MAEGVRYERIGSAAVLTIDRPERRNAVDGATARALREGFEGFEADDGARALVLTGAGGDAFCAGADLKALDLDVDDPAGPMGFSRLAASKPTIAAIDGWCLAGGVELALWCDLRLATPGSTFGLFERRWGVPLVDGGTQRLPRVIGLGRALDLILTGRPVDADEAERIGLVTAVTAPGAHLDRALELAEALAAFPQETMLADRRAAIEGIGLPFAEGLVLEHRLGRETLDVAARGAARFASGEGRHGAPAARGPATDDEGADPTA
jgi:enoyl-CoA hydratase